MTAEHVHIHGTYEPALVILSLLIAVMAGYSALDLAGRVAAARGSARVAWLAGGATALGSGIWAMHFTGMLAHQLPYPVSYDLPTVIFSLLIAIGIAVPALQLSGGASLAWPRLLGGGVLVGVGILAMHYSGMWALRQVTLSYDPALVALSAVIAVVAASVAMRVAFTLREATGTPALPRKLGAALLLGLAISGMHYTGMAATAFTPLDEPTSALALSVIALPLGIGIAVISLVIFGITLAMSLLDRRLDRQNRALLLADQQYRSLFDHHPDAVFALDRNGVCRSLNPAAAALFGRSAAALIGQDLAALLPEPEQAALRAMIDVALNGAATQGDLVWPDQAGAQRRVRVTYVPMVLDGAVAGLYLIVHDETARYAA
jgi:PAS domain S-box-containing protein